MATHEAQALAVAGINLLCCRLPLKSLLESVYLYRNIGFGEPTGDYGVMGALIPRPILQNASSGQPSPFVHLPRAMCARDPKEVISLGIMVHTRLNLPYGFRKSINING